MKTYFENIILVFVMLTLILVFAYQYLIEGRIIFDGSQDSRSILLNISKNDFDKTNSSHTKIGKFLNLPESPLIQNYVNQLLAKASVPKFNKKFDKNSYNIIFLKTHKTGSSTIQNILFNFVFNRQNLKSLFPLPKGPLQISDTQIKSKLDFSTNLVYPIKTHLFYGYPNPFTQEVVDFDLPPGNIIAHHTKYSTDLHNFFQNQDYHGVKNSSPSNNTFRFTILRNPRTLLKSAYFYYSNSREARSSNYNFTVFINNPEQYHNKNAGGYLRNSQKSDLGLINMDVKEAIKFLEKSFDLIMILEKFDESLILLKDHLSDWQMKDLIYLVKNSRAKEESSEKISSLSSSFSDENQKIDQWAEDDTIIYHYFSKILDQKIENYGPKKMQTQVEQLRRLSKSVVDKCFTEDRTDSWAKKKTLYWFPPNGKISIPWVKDEQINNTLCRNLGRSERKYHYTMHKIAKAYYEAN